jgi:Family of unknown function (DUF6152)
MKQRTAGVLAALMFLLGSESVWAHHSPSAIFDMQHRLTMTGVCTRVDWVNPHIQLRMNVKDASGKLVNWTLESNPPAWFKKAGVTRSDLVKAVGQTITVDGMRAKDGSNYGYFLKITFADGTSVEWNSLLDQAFGQKSETH